jgi:hypothetical protein
MTKGELNARGCSESDVTSCPRATLMCQSSRPAGSEKYRCGPFVNGPPIAVDRRDAMRICIRMLLFTVSLRLCAQPACPTLNFLNAQTVNLKPSPTSHVDAVRQFDGSYTAFEVADAPPHRIITKMPHFERQFGACVPHVVPSSHVPAPPPVANPLGAGSQAQVVSMLPSGNYMVAGINGAAWSDPIPSIIYFDVFDSGLQLISENAVAAPNAGESFVGLAFADLNRDGKLDVVALSEVHTGHGFAFPAIWSFLGNGDGTFQAGKRQAVAGSLLYGAISFTVGDLNNDQKPDFILGSLGPDSVVALGNGDGTFSQVQPWSAYSTTGGVALGDLNGDGRLDRVLVDLNAGLVYVALGNGDGSFQPFQSYPCLTIPFKAAITASAEVAIGDVNGDSIPDIVTASGTIFFGDGKGAFPNRRDYLVGGNESVMLADFDGDGKVDILIGAGNPDFISGSPDHPTLTVLFGRGGGAFVAAPVTWGSTESMVTADFDGDGIPDLAVTSGRVLSILKGRGNGDFSSVFRYDLPGAPAKPVVADLNHDGMPDLVMLVSTSAGTPPELLLFFGRGDGTLASPLTVPVPDNSASFLAAADLNGDNLPDLVVTGQSSVWVWIARGGGLFASPLAYPVEGTGLPSLAIGDFNGDGKPDMAVAVQSPGGIALLLGKGDGTFAPGTTIPVSVPSTGSDPVLVGPLQLAAADLNGDGRLDLAATFGNYGGSSTGSAIALLLGKGDGTFQSPATVTEPAVQIAAADLNGDNIPDLVVTLGGITPGTAVLVGNGDAGGASYAGFP